MNGVTANDDPSSPSVSPSRAPVQSSSPQSPYSSLPQSELRPDEFPSNGNHVITSNSGSNRYEEDISLAISMSLQDTQFNSGPKIFPLPLPQAKNDVNSMWQSARDIISQDTEMAMRIHQEEKDAQVARDLQASEDQRMLEMQQQRAERADNNAVGDENRNQGVRRKFCSASLLCTIVAGGAVLILFYGADIWEGVGGDLHDLPPFFQDPWDGQDIGNGTSVGTFSSWRNKQEGLTLTLVNALTSDWYDYFELAVQEWDDCPALQLSVSIVPPDPTCVAINGQMKVCNAEYGYTSWTGLNEVYFDSKSYIISSVAKMNESYLKTASNGEHQYVMCHEIGHGFGLPHRDENSNNPDLGTCLDYTLRPEKNMHPDEVDCDHLTQIYGDRSRREMSQSRTHTDEDRWFQRMVSRKRHYKEGRLLYQSRHREVYESNLGNNVTLITTVLLATQALQDQT